MLLAVDPEGRIRRPRRTGERGACPGCGARFEKLVRRFGEADHGQLAAGEVENPRSVGGVPAQVILKPSRHVAAVKRLPGRVGTATGNHTQEAGRILRVGRRCLGIGDPG